MYARITIDDSDEAEVDLFHQLENLDDVKDFELADENGLSVAEKIAADAGVTTE